MNILHVNKYHYYGSGADTVYLRTAELLNAHGHNCLFFSMHHPQNLPSGTSAYFMSYVDLNERKNLIGQLKIAGRILYSIEARECLSNLLDNNPVDIAHLHNMYHQISPSILHELKKRNIPVIMTLHDLKMVCASYLMFFAGKLCEECSGGKYYMAIKNKCVKNSFVKSMLAALEMYLHHTILDIYDNVDIFISPSHFLKEKLLSMGFNKEIIYLPNFFDIRELRETEQELKVEINDREKVFLYIGRLSFEKGLITLLNAMKILNQRDRGIEVKIIGEGPLKEVLQEKIKAEKIQNIEFLGYMSHKRLYLEIKKSLAVVLPSEWYENSPLVVIEAFALARPVIGSRLGGIPELVKDYERGLTFEAGNVAELCEKVKFLTDNKNRAETMGQNARLFVEQELNAEKHYNQLIEIYRQAIGKRRN